MKFRKKPVVVDAEQWRPGDEEQAARLGITDYMFIDGVMTASIDTLEGRALNVKPGDWIITGIKGERYPCDNEIFHLTYEAVP